MTNTIKEVCITKELLDTLQETSRELKNAALRTSHRLSMCQVVFTLLCHYYFCQYCHNQYCHYYYCLYCHFWVIPYESTEKNMEFFFLRISDQKNQEF